MANKHSFRHAVEDVVMQELEQLPVPWEVVRKKSHWFVKIEGQDGLVCVGGDSKKVPRHTITMVRSKLRSIRQSLS